MNITVKMNGDKVSLEKYICSNEREVTGNKRTLKHVTVKKHVSTNTLVTCSTIKELPAVDQWLPLDVWRVISEYLPVSQIIAMSQVNKYVRLLAEKFYTTKLGPFTLSAQQYIFTLRINEIFKAQEPLLYKKPDPPVIPVIGWGNWGISAHQLQNKYKCIVSAPMGWGKTMMAIFYIDTYNKTKNSLIVVPPHVLKVWVTELEGIGFIKPDPGKSKVLVYHNMRTKHMAYAKNNNVFSNHKIVICTCSMYSTLLYIYCGSIPNRLNSNITESAKIDMTIVDEFHKCSTWPFVNQIGLDGGQLLGLTAEDVVTDDLSSVLKLKDIEYVDRIPDISFKFYIVDNGENSYHKAAYHINDIVRHETLYATKLKECLKKKKKAVICVDRGSIGDMTRRWVNQIVKGDDPLYKVFELRSSTKVITSFLNYNGKAVLFIGPNNNEGLNIFAKHIIIIKPDMMNCARLRQTVNRVRRPNNTNTKVTCSFIAGGQVAFLKSFYAACYSNPSWLFKYDETPTELYLLKCLNMIGLLGYDDILNLSMVDGCIIFDYNQVKSRKDEVVEWWKLNREEHTILSVKKIERIYCA